MTAVQEYLPGLPVTTQLLALAQHIITQESPAVDNDGLGNITWRLPRPISAVPLMLEADLRTSEFDARHVVPREVGVAQFTMLATGESISVRRGMTTELDDDELSSEVLGLFTSSLQHPHELCLQAVDRVRLERQRKRNPFDPFPAEPPKINDRRRIHFDPQINS